MSSSARPNCFFGWVVVAICTISKVCKCQGQNNIMAYTVPHLLEDFGLSHSELGGLFAVATISAGFTQPNMGRLVDRLGGRVCMSLAQLTLAGTLLAFAFWPRPRWLALLYVEVVGVFFFLRALSLGACETFPSATVQQWFVRRRGRAMAVMNTGQQVGVGLVGVFVQRGVANLGWRQVALAGSMTNLLLSPICWAVVRSNPESCGLLPDGDVGANVVCAEEPSVAPEATKALETEAPQQSASVDEPLPAAIWPLLAFAFFYAVIFGGCDFNMVEMVSEAGGLAGGVNISKHIYATVSLTTATVGVAAAELMDRYGANNPQLLSALMALSALLTHSNPIHLTLLTSPTMAVSYGIVRGVASGIYTPLITSGLAFAAMGVTRDRIGRALGLSQMFVISGTGAGPLFYAALRDLAGAYRGGLVLTAMPPLVLGLYFAGRSLRPCLRGARSVVRAATVQTSGIEVVPIGQPGKIPKLSPLDAEHVGLLVEGAVASSPSFTAPDEFQVLQEPAVSPPSTPRLQTELRPELLPTLVGNRANDQEPTKCT